MYRAHRTLLLLALEPLHVGTAAGSRRVDLPVARDVVDGDPILPFSALRGMLAEAAASDREWLAGARDREGSDRSQRGAVAFTDARPLLFPVRSGRGGFAWITCPRVLRTFGEIAGGPKVELVDDGAVRLPASSRLRIGRPSEGGGVVLAGQHFPARQADGVVGWLAGPLGQLGVEETALVVRLAVVPDSVWANLLATETDVRHRVAVDRETATVKPGALFAVEVIPRDTIFFGRALALSPKVYERGQTADAVQALSRAADRLAAADHLTIGGEITVGMGRCRARLI